MEVAGQEHRIEMQLESDAFDKPGLGPVGDADSDLPALQYFV